jgi:carboxypeptidase family protein
MIRQLPKLLAVLTLVCACPTARAQANGRVVSGVVRDSSSGQPLSGAIVELSAQATRLITRTDQAGRFQFAGLQRGQFQLAVRRIGYAVAVHEVRVVEADVSVSIALVATPGRLDTIRVLTHVPAITGVVGTANGLQPLAGAAVQIVGANERITTDSTGRFFAPLKKPGSYFVRVRRDGFAPQVVSVEVPPDRAVETAVLLDSSLTRQRPGTDARWADFDERVRWQSMNGAVVTSTELQRYGGGSASDALRASQSFVKKGLRIGPVTCLFIDGIPKPGWQLDAIPPEQIAAVEVYTRSGDATGTLASQWPDKQTVPGLGPCRTPMRRSPSAGVEASTVMYVAIWLKQSR